MGYPLAVGALILCVLLSIGIIKTVIAQGPVRYWLSGWEPPWGIEYYVDHLSAFMLVLVSSIKRHLAHGEVLHQAVRESQEKCGGRIELRFPTASVVVDESPAGDVPVLAVLLEQLDYADSAAKAIRRN